MIHEKLLNWFTKIYFWPCSYIIYLQDFCKLLNCMVVKDSWYLTSYTVEKPIWTYMQRKKSSSLDIHAAKNQVRGWHSNKEHVGISIKCICIQNLREKRGSPMALDYTLTINISHCSGAKQTMENRHSRDIYGLPTWRWTPNAQRQACKQQLLIW